MSCHMLCVIYNIMTYIIPCLFQIAAMQSEAGMGIPPLTLVFALPCPGTQSSDDNGDIPRNAGTLAVPVPDAAASPMKSYRRL
jgi:hypothetical protein